MILRNQNANQAPTRSRCKSTSCLSHRSTSLLLKGYHREHRGHRERTDRIWPREGANAGCRPKAASILTLPNYRRKSIRQHSRHESILLSRTLTLFLCALGVLCGRLSSTESVNGHRTVITRSVQPARAAAEVSEAVDAWRGPIVAYTVPPILWAYPATTSNSTWSRFNVFSSMTMCQGGRAGRSARALPRRREPEHHILRHGDRRLNP